MNDPEHQYTIETTSLTRRFGDVLAVDQVGLRVPRHGIYAFLGPNGAGKTTTIRMLLGLIRPDEGEVHLFGRPLAKNRRELLRRVGALVETPSLYDHLSGRDNLEITRRLLGKDRRHIDRVLDIVGLSADAHRRAAGYSLGMRQRLGLALALLGEPELLVLDEPTNGLDPAGIQEMRGLITSLAREHGATVFLSSHLLSEVEVMADHLGIVRGGRLSFQGTLAELQSQRQGYLAVKLGRPEGADAPTAADLLATAGFRVQSESGDRLEVTPINGSPALDPAAISDLNALLVGQGFRVHHLSLRQPSLESLFLHLTEGKVE